MMTSGLSAGSTSLRFCAATDRPVVASGALIPQPVLDSPTVGWVNLHFSLLPAWRGAAPVAAAVDTKIGPRPSKPPGCRSRRFSSALPI